MSSDQMKINIDWGKTERNIKSKKKWEPQIPKKNTQITSKLKMSKTPEKIRSEFINSIKYKHDPGKLSIEIGYSLDNQKKDQQGIHVKTLNKEQIQGIKRLLDIFNE
ncbi:hypothetical protein DSAG12_02564 [Promethearchaeum syntrophicum]|uniref:Uncharacterized protein n=1 Tax=Promethearchaeum syntrophicum TaxID=2594042 RepID=A0A5B9DC37_9ARCH|nr:hypothetical protein [Candidatus Prometheoarchaeum syntrophicum]QEE16734.1 hypothetical protein DSAG12_02564 [Candidatus Prometheoarchaeum syntrophicum]